MPTLTDEIKTFIVKGLACYDTPSQVAEAVKAEFNIEITRQHVYAYDPNASQHMAPRWRELHAATRAALLRELAEIGIAHRAVRLRRLDRLASRSERHNVTTALKCIEMAAKECGGMYENRKPIVAQPTAPQPALPQYATPEPPAPQPAAAQAAMPERAAPQAVAPRPQATELQPTTPRHAVPLPVLPQPDRPAPSCPRPLAVLALPPQPPSSSEARPLSREERFRAWARDRDARDRVVAAETLSDSGRISTAPPAS
ncbi:DUF2280 domain-containing protein [Dongia sedimenti]|uniref:DUF2280 domain-containing protein n=1 Tax=Dongia sedimenti TaxID=3064282 RepID=A0ABU0YH65_9PROT|nr:DUF2280 domain-containing protein [Rhodospirillaceae bacterium R-7]